MGRLWVEPRILIWPAVWTELPSAELRNTG